MINVSTWSGKLLIVLQVCLPKKIKSLKMKQRLETKYLMLSKKEEGIPGNSSSFRPKCIKTNNKLKRKGWRNKNKKISLKRDKLLMSNSTSLQLKKVPKGLKGETKMFNILHLCLSKWKSNPEHLLKQELQFSKTEKHKSIYLTVQIHFIKCKFKFNKHIH